MARAYGHNVQLLFAYESTYGTPPATGAYFKLPVINCDLGYCLARTPIDPIDFPMRVQPS